MKKYECKRCYDEIFVLLGKPALAKRYVQTTEERKFFLEGIIPRTVLFRYVYMKVPTAIASDIYDAVDELHRDGYLNMGEIKDKKDGEIYWHSSENSSG